jgi:hypothetical protein
MINPIIIDFQGTVIEVVEQIVPAVDAVIQCQAHRTFGYGRFSHLRNLLAQLIHDRQGLFQPQLLSLIGLQSGFFRLTLDLI